MENLQFQSYIKPTLYLHKAYTLLLTQHFGKERLVVTIKFSREFQTRCL